MKHEIPNTAFYDISAFRAKTIFHAYLVAANLSIKEANDLTAGMKLLVSEYSTIKEHEFEEDSTLNAGVMCVSQDNTFIKLTAPKSKEAMVSDTLLHRRGCTFFTDEENFSFTFTADKPPTCQNKPLTDATRERLEKLLKTHDLSEDGKYYQMKSGIALIYRQSVAEQLRLWLLGASTHTKDLPEGIEFECCPDFSCCDKTLLWPVEKRQAFAAATEEERLSLLVGGLEHMLTVQDVNLVTTKMFKPKS